jgi:hypothetical protein
MYVRLKKKEQLVDTTSVLKNQMSSDWTGKRVYLRISEPSLKNNKILTYTRTFFLETHIRELRVCLLHGSSFSRIREPKMMAGEVRANCCRWLAMFA